MKEEAKLLKELSHKNIIKIYEYGELDSCVYIKMELAKGGTLRIISIIKRVTLKRRRDSP